MWLRFSEQARLAVIAAQEAADAGPATEVQVHHLLSGVLAASERDAGDWWSAVGPSAARLREALTKGRGAGCSGAGGTRRAGPEREFGDQAKRALQQAYNAARDLGAEQVAVRHLLLGVLAAPDETVTRAVRQLEIDLAEVRRRIAEEGGPQEPGEEKVG